MTVSQTESSVRYRAAKACKRCNQRRVKCDAVEKGTPCTRCSQSDHPDCVLLKSRRGTYPRKKARTNQSNEQQEASPNTNSPVHTSDAPIDLSQAQHLQQQDGSQVIGGLQRTKHSSSQGARATNNHESSRQLQTSGTAAQPIATARGRPDEGDFASPESNLTVNSNVSSYCEISWAAMFEKFLNSRKQPRRDMIDKCSITYLGESFPLSIVLADLNGGRPRLHHAGPPLEETPTLEEAVTDQAHPPHVPLEDIVCLEAKKVFEYPPSDILEALMAAFLDRYWPIYPIVLRQEVIQQHKNKTMPWILLHAICFMAATYCPTAFLYRAGFVSRKQARFAYYRKAKALFDTGYERNKIVILQSVIMLTFWGGGPNNYWNFYSWISTGVTIAETLGMHRSLRGTNMKPQDSSLLKRLWWTLVIRDAFCGALVGRPFRINMQHCDTETLTDQDFEFDLESPEFATHPQRKVFGAYQIHMTQLALILRDIVAVRFEPGQRATAANYHDSLLEWRRQLPAELSWTESSTSMNMFASCLCIQYNHHIILSHLGSLTADNPSLMSQSPGIGVREIPENAAHRISTLACSIVTRSQVLSMSHEAFQGLFLAMVVFYTQMKSPQSLLVQLGRTALNNCQLVLHDARDAWDPSPWIMKLFDNLTSNLEEESPEQGIYAEAFPGNSHNLENSMMNIFGGNSFEPEFDNWQGAPLLGNLFGLSDDTEFLQMQGFS